MKDRHFKSWLLSGIAVLVLTAALAIHVHSLYVDHQVETRRVEAQSALIELRGLLEQRYQVFGRYTESGGIAPVLPFNSLPRQGGPAHYRLTLDAQPSAYTLRAVPTGSQSRDACGILTLNQKGEVGAVKPDCWPTP